VLEARKSWHFMNSRAIWSTVCRIFSVRSGLGVLALMGAVSGHALVDIARGGGITPGRVADEIGVAA